MVTVEQVWAALEEIPDPEIPVISLVDLGVVKRVEIEGASVRIDFTPTFMGCPALDTMQRAMVDKVEELGAEAEVRVVLDDSWSTDKITAAGKLELVQLQRGFRCPYCGSTDTALENIFGPTPCRSIRYCNACRQPFEQFKTI